MYITWDEPIRMLVSCLFLITYYVHSSCYHCRATYDKDAKLFLRISGRRLGGRFV